MQTITLKVSDSVYEKFMWFLSYFSSEEVMIEDVEELPKEVVDKILQEKSLLLDEFFTEEELEW